jgi:transcriptional regulator with XRE-family HTH domain
MNQPTTDGAAKKKGGRPRNPAIHADRILAARRALNLSRSKVAKAMLELGCTISEEAIASWEEGRYTPPPSRLAALCAVLKLKVEDVLVGDAASQSAA